MKTIKRKKKISEKKKRKSVIKQKIKEAMIDLFGTNNYKSDKNKIKKSNSSSKINLLENHNNNTNNDNFAFEKEKISDLLIRDANPDICLTNSTSNVYENEKFVSIDIDNDVIKKMNSLRLEDIKIQKENTNISSHESFIKNDNYNGFSHKIELLTIINKDNATKYMLLRRKILIELLNYISNIDMNIFYKNNILDNLAEFIFKRNILSKPILISLDLNLMKNLYLKIVSNLSNSNLDMIKFSISLVFLFHRISIKLCIQPNNMKNNYDKYIKTLKKIIRDIDLFSLKKWVNVPTFKDWCYFIFSIFITHENDIHLMVINNISIINNVIRYLGIIDFSKFSISDNDDTLTTDHNMCNNNEISKNKNELHQIHTTKDIITIHQNEDNYVSNSQPKPRISPTIAKNFFKKMIVYNEVDKQFISHKSTDLIQPNNNTNETNSINNDTNEQLRSIPQETITLNNSTQTNVQQTINQSNDTNMFMNTTYDNNDYPRCSQNTSLMSSNGTLSIQSPSILHENLNQFTNPDNFNNTQLPPNSTILSGVSSMDLPNRSSLKISTPYPYYTSPMNFNNTQLPSTSSTILSSTSSMISPDRSSLKTSTPYLHSPSPVNFNNTQLPSSNTKCSNTSSKNHPDKNSLRTKTPYQCTLSPKNLIKTEPNSKIFSDALSKNRNDRSYLRTSLKNPYHRSSKNFITTELPPNNTILSGTSSTIRPDRSTLRLSTPNLHSPSVVNFNDTQLPSTSSTTLTGASSTSRPDSNSLKTSRKRPYCPLSMNSKYSTS